ncbi:MAG: hypothetical protein ACXVCP_18010 [Bdellovibrio sp.]
MKSSIKIIFLFFSLLSSVAFAHPNSNTLFTGVVGSTLRIDSEINLPPNSEQLFFASWKKGSILNANQVEDYINRYKAEAKDGKSLSSVSYCSIYSIDREGYRDVTLTEKVFLKLDTIWGENGLKAKLGCARGTSDKCTPIEINLFCSEIHQSPNLCSDNDKACLTEYHNNFGVTERVPTFGQVQEILKGFMYIDTFSIPSITK